MRNYEATRHPELYRETHWGLFKIKDEACIREIIEARNRFADEFRLRSSTYLQTASWAMDEAMPELTGRTFMCDFVDHRETYRTQDKGVVLVVSPYQPDSYTLPAVGVAVGFRPYPRMYHPHALTFVATYPSIAAIRAIFTAAIKKHAEGLQP
jgi:hypothetical protein